MFMQYMTDHLDLHMIQSIIYVQKIVKLFKHAKTYEYLPGVQSPKLTEYKKKARVSWNTIPCHKKQTNHATSEVFCIILVHVEVHLLILHIAVVLGPPSVCCPKKAVDLRSVLATEFLERAVIFDQPSGGRVGHG